MTVHGPLAAGDSRVSGTWFTLPAGHIQPGTTYTVFVRTNSGAAPVESNTGNNDGKSVVDVVAGAPPLGLRRPRRI